MSIETLEKHILEGRNIFLTGAGGTGKTFELQAMLKKYPANFVVTSSTGISAMGLHELARTIHSFSTIGTSSNEQFPTTKCLEYFDYMKERDLNAIIGTKRLIVEEISMISASQLNLIDRVFRRVRKCYNKPFGNIQMIFAGDFLQLESVSKKDEEKNEFAFQARAWKEANPVTVYLNEVKRTTNKEFAELCLRVRTINHTAADFKLMKSLENNILVNQPLVLVASNKRADEENVKQLALLSTKKEIYKGKYRGPKDSFRGIREGLLCPHELELKEGCRVMITSNERRYDTQDDRGEPLEYVNGSLGTFLGGDTRYTTRQFEQFQRDEETNEIIRDSKGRPNKFFDNIQYDVLCIKLDTGKYIELRRMSWTDGDFIENKDTGKPEWEIEYKQFPVRLAYAITIHKAQGLSIESLEIDCEGIFANSQFYVALSRARSLEGLKIKNLKGKYIKASVDALEFYKNLDGV
jgi:ATP-dependent DNA helicase PIF1